MMKIMDALEYLDEMISDPRMEKGTISIWRDGENKLHGQVRLDRIEISQTNDSLFWLLINMGIQAKSLLRD